MSPENLEQEAKESINDILGFYDIEDIWMKNGFLYMKKTDNEGKQTVYRFQLSVKLLGE